MAWFISWSESTLSEGDGDEDMVDMGGRRTVVVEWREEVVMVERER